MTNRTGWTPRVHQHSAVSIKADAEIWTFGGTGKTTQVEGRGKRGEGRGERGREGG